MLPSEVDEISVTEPSDELICDKNKPLSLRKPYKFPVLWSTVICSIPLLSNDKTCFSLPSSKLNAYILLDDELN